MPEIDTPELLPTQGSECKESIFDISMTPIRSLDLGDTGYIAGTKSMCGLGEEDNSYEKEEWKGGR